MCELFFWPAELFYAFFRGLATTYEITVEVLKEIGAICVGSESLPISTG